MPEKFRRELIHCSQAVNEKSSKQRHILDNRTAKVFHYLQENLANADSFRLVSAYFSIYGYNLLAKELNTVRQVCFLFGDPASIKEPDPVAKEPKSFAFTERGLSPHRTLQQKQLARQCAQWMQKDAVKVRSVRHSNFLHGKMYLAESAGKTPSAVIGSSNFTQRGLGGNDDANLEINIALSDGPLLAELRAWFDKLWSNDDLTYDAKREALNTLNRLGKDYDPEFIYFKTLYELFRNALKDQDDSDRHIRETRLRDTAIWNAPLFRFQEDGAKSVISKLNRHNGCILADSVGLGKTYTALAVIKYYELRNERVLVLCPKKLMGNWSLYHAANRHKDNPFPEDRFGYTLLAHTDLSRERGKFGGINFANFNWSAFDMVVIDESHNFRNDGGKRYQRLLDSVIKSGARTKVLMLSATPVNTSLLDLRNQIYLMTEKREDVFRESLGVGDIRQIMKDAQREFQIWEGGLSRDKSTLLENLGADFLRLLDGVSISRSRRQIERFYADDLKEMCMCASPRATHPKTSIRPPIRSASFPTTGSPPS